MAKHVSYINLLQSKTHSYVTKIVFVVFHVCILTPLGKMGKGGKLAKYGKSKPYILLAKKHKKMAQNLPRKLSLEALREFKELYLEEFSEILTDDEAEEIALRVIRFFGILAQRDGPGTDR